MEEQMVEKNFIKKDVGSVGWCLILYMLINYGIVMIDIVWKTVSIIMKTSDEVLQNQQIDALAESAGSMIIGVLLGMVVLYFCMSKKIDVKEMFAEKKKMTGKTFVALLSIFMAAQLLGSIFYSLLEVRLNMFGYTAEASMEAATDSSNTISMFLYASFIAPVVEELVYRGFTLEPLRKYGKVFAILISAVLFGVMHGNLPQAAFAFGVGLVLGYVAVEYSIKWSILILILNNFVFAELIGMAGRIFGENVELLLNGMIIYGFFFVGMGILWKHRKEIKNYIEENTTEAEVYRYALTAVPILLFIIVNLLFGVLMLEPLA